MDGEGSTSPLNSALSGRGPLLDCPDLLALEPSWRRPLCRTSHGPETQFVDSRPTPAVNAADTADAAARPEASSASAPLQLDTALQLLQQSGLAVPDGAPGSAELLQAVIDGLVNISSKDPLTGLANRRSFELALARELDRVARSGEPALLLTLDIDHFKRVNDNHGHAAGDLIIKAVAGALLDSVRPMDLVARVGGEEFSIILPNCPSPFGETVAERIRRRVEATMVAIAPEQLLCVTVSIGGAFAPQWVRSTPALWTERADQQLYRAKAHGRNLVRLEPSAVSVVSSEERRMLFDHFESQEHE